MAFLTAIRWLTPPANFDAALRASTPLARRKLTFLRAWCAVAYAFPGLHPDGYEDAGSGWPRVLKRFAAEAWRRNDAGELLDEEMYPCDAAWAGIYDRLGVTTADENEHRVEIAAHCGALADG